MAVAAYWLINEHHHSALYEYTAVKPKYLPMQVLNTCYMCHLFAVSEHVIFSEYFPFESVVLLRYVG